VCCEIDELGDDMFEVSEMIELSFDDAALTPKALARQKRTSID